MSSIKIWLLLGLWAVSTQAHERLFHRNYNIQPRMALGLGFATCGELLQQLVNGIPSLVTATIYGGTLARASHPLFRELDGKISITTNSGGLYVFSGDADSFPKTNLTKTARAVRLLLDYIHHGKREHGVQIGLKNHLPVGKGFATSTSDIVASLVATAALFGVRPSWTQIGKFVHAVERADPTYQPGIVHTSPVTGQVFKRFRPMKLQFLVVDTAPEGTVETVSFDRDLERRVNQKEKKWILAAQDQLYQGFYRGNPLLVGRAANINSTIYQYVDEKPYLEDLIEATWDIPGVVGVNVAHTGTAIGVMFVPNETNMRLLSSVVASITGAEKILGVKTLMSGGIFYRIIRHNEEHLPFSLDDTRLDFQAPGILVPN